MIKNSLLEKRLKSYSALAVGVLALGGAASGQVVYTDIDPDFLADADGLSYELDLNNDGTIDFTINRSAGTAGAAIRMSAGSGNEVLGAISYGVYFLPYALSEGDAINDAQTLWNGTMNNNHLTLAWGSTYGYWTDDLTDKYLGLRIVVDSDTFYGWARMDVTAGGTSFTIKDYAFESTAGEGILAGNTSSAVSANLITDLTVADVANNGNGSDLQADFNRPTDESTVSEYRIMVVDSANVAGFDLAAAEAVASANYTVVSIISKGDVTLTFDAAATDVNGNAIAEDVPYKVFVLSMADGTNATANALSDPSDQITLENTAGISILESNINMYSFGETLVVNSKNMELRNALITIYDISGRQVYNAELISDEVRIQLNKQSSQFYLVKINTQKGDFVKKIYLK